MAAALLFLAWTRLGRLASRFEALVAAVRSGRLPSARAPRVQAAGDFELPLLEGLPQPFRLPSGFGWLIRLVPGAAAYSGQVQHLLADPEMAALLAASPQASRILRPLCQMLAVRLGPELGATRRGRSASAARPTDSEGQPEASATLAVPPSSSPRGIPPASPAAPGSQLASTGSHFAAQDEGPGLGSRPWPAPPAGSRPGPGLEAPPAPPLQTGLPGADEVGRAIVAGADPPVSRA